MNFAKFLRTSLAKASRMTASCVYLWILRSFSDHLFYRAPLGNCIFHLQAPQFWPVKRISQKLFKHFLQEENGYLKAFIYIKSLKIKCEELNLWWGCEMPTFKLMKKTLSRIVLYAFCLHFFRINTITFSEDALKVCEHNFIQEI